MRRDHQDQPGPEDPGRHLDPIEQARLRERARQARVAKVLVGLFLVIVFIVFIVQNSKRVPIDFVFFTRQARLIWIMLFCGILGGIVGFLVGRPGKQLKIRGKHEAPPHDKDKNQNP